MPDYDGEIIYMPSVLPDPENLMPGTIFKDNHGNYWELSSWMGEPQRVGSWYRLHKARVRKLRKVGRIPKDK